METNTKYPCILKILQEQNFTLKFNKEIKVPISNKITGVLPEFIQEAENLKVFYSEVIGCVFDLLIRSDIVEDHRGNIFESPIGKSPTVTIKEYICDRINKYACNTYRDIIYAIALIDKIHKIDPTILPIRKRSIHRIYATALLLAIKFDFDKCYYNNYYAKIFGISDNELACLEKEMFRMLDFNVMIDDNILMQYINAVNKLYIESIKSIK